MNWLQRRWLRWRFRKVRIVYTMPTIHRIPSRRGQIGMRCTANYRIEGKLPEKWERRLRAEIEASHAEQFHSAADAFRHWIETGAR